MTNSGKSEPSAAAAGIVGMFGFRATESLNAFTIPVAYPIDHPLSLPEKRPGDVDRMPNERGCGAVESHVVLFARIHL